MASPVDICNTALGLLGDNARVAAIEPIPDGSMQADHCRRYYPLARDALLTMHAWSFNTRRQALALLDTDELPNTWQFAYALPSDCLKPLAVLIPQTTTGAIATDLSVPFGTFDPLRTRVPADTDTQDFIVETLADGSQAIFTNTENANLRYSITITDTTKFIPLFVPALARLLASYLAGPIIKGKIGMQVGEAHLDRFEKVDFPRAAAANAMARKANVYNTFIPSSLAARA